MTKVLAHKLISYMPDKIPVEQFIIVFCKLDQMIELQKISGKEIEWEELIAEVNSWETV